MAANHIFGLGDVVATTATVVAILAVSTMPLYAQPSTVQLNADAQNLFKIISSDKRKIQIFCKIADLGNQLDQADQVHDTKKVEEVSRKLDEWQGKLPEFTALVGGLTDLNPNSDDAQEIGSIILKLDEFCD
jgi:cell division protein FtsL